MNGKAHHNWKMDENGKYQTGVPKKWTQEVVLEEMKELYKLLSEPFKGIAPTEQQKQNPIKANDLMSVKGACLIRGYSSQRYSEWCNQFKEDKEFTEIDKSIRDLIELRLQYVGMKNPAMPIFILKNHYDYSDKRVIQNEEKRAVVFPIINITAPLNGTTDGSSNS